MQDILTEWGGPKQMEVRRLSVCASHASMHYNAQPCATRMRTCSLPVLTPRHGSIVLLQLYESKWEKECAALVHKLNSGSGVR